MHAGHETDAFHLVDPQTQLFRKCKGYLTEHHSTPWKGLPWRWMCWGMFLLLVGAYTHGRIARSKKTWASLISCDGFSGSLMWLTLRSRSRDEYGRRHTFSPAQPYLYSQPYRHRVLLPPGWPFLRNGQENVYLWRKGVWDFTDSSRWCPTHSIQTDACWKVFTKFWISLFSPHWMEKG